jgi:hypothetical protein
MENDEFIAQQQTKIATKMVRVAALLSKEMLTAEDFERIETDMQSIRYYAEGKPKGLESEISMLARAVALRAAKTASTGIPEADVVAFGNGAHVVLPKEHIGKWIRYVLEDYGGIRYCRSVRSA